MAENFCFIVDSINFMGKLPVEIISGHWFRKATTEEIQRIKQELSNHSSNPDIVFMMYEHKFVPEKKDGTSQKSVPLPSKDWRYYVISFNGFNDKILNIEYSANLLKHDINIGFTFFSQQEIGAYGIGYNPFITSTFFADKTMDFQQEISLKSNELLEIKTNYNSITNLDKLLYANISRAIADFHYIKMITNRSALKVLSYFSIIECILTHNPRPIDTIDSLTHQIWTKMSLLSKMFQRKLDYTLHFPQLKEPEKVWKELYSYRSTIAHGGEAKFDGSFKSLVSQDKVQEFLKESLKLLLLYSLKEPEFITDLQRC
jgi:hypothetical protein